jgi:hypothetical protein
MSIRTFLHRWRGPRKLIVVAFSVALIASLAAQPLLAAAPYAIAQQETTGNSGATSYGVSCQDGVCSVAFDLGEMELATQVPKDMPVKLALPEGVVPFLSKGASLEIGDSIALSLPFGSIRMADGDFNLHLDENGQLDRLHGTSSSIMPSINLGPNLQIAGPFAAEVGYDFGSTLSGLSTVLDPDRRYLFFHLGSGLELDARTPGAGVDGEPLRFSIPEGDRFSIVIDPQASLMYLDGRLTLAQLTDLGLLLSLMGLPVASLPLLSGVVLPTRTTIGVGGLLSTDMSKNFLQLTGGMGINGGPLARLLRIEGEPLGFDGMLRVDSDGLLLGGVARSSLNPDQVLDSRGELSLFIPFSLGELPYLQLGGALRVPAVGLDTEVAQQIGGGAVSELTSSNAMLQSTAEAASTWWNNTGAWMSNVATTVGDGSEAALSALQDAAAGTSDAISGGASTAWNGAGSGTGSLIEGAGTVVGAGVDAAGKALQAAGEAIKNAGSAAGSAAGAAGAAVKGAGSAMGDGTGKALEGAGGAVSAGVDAAGKALQTAGDAVKGAGSAVGAGASGAASAASGAAAGTTAVAGSAWSSTTSAADCATQQARNLWCQTTGFCEVQEVVCE